MNAAAEVVTGEVVQAEDLRDVNNAVARFDAVAAGIAALQKQFGGVVYDVTTPKGMEAAREARRAIREPRYEIEKVRKAAKAPILSLGRRIDGEAERITNQLLAIEDPIDQQIKVEEAREKAEREAELERERQRLAAIDAQIDAMRRAPTEVANKPAAIIRARLDEFYAPIEFDFQERVDIAKSARAETIAQLETMLAEREAFEAEQVSIAEERARLDEQRRKDEEAAAARRREEDERRQAEEARLAQERERLRLEAEKRQREDDERRLQEEARLQAERDRLAAQRAEQERQERERQEQVTREEREREEARRAEQLKRDQEETERQARIREEEERIAAQRREIEQERAFVAATGNLAEHARAALAATDIATAEAALNQILAMDFDAATYGDRAGDLHDIVSAEHDRIADHCQRLQAAIDAAKTSEPTPPAVADLTAAPSPEGAEAATAAPAQEETLLRPYPGEQALIEGIAEQFDISREAALQWLTRWAADRAVAEAAA